MKKWFKKYVEAIQFVDTNKRIMELSDFMGIDIAIDYKNPKKPIFKFTNINNNKPTTHLAKEKDWIVKEDGKFSVCENKRFIKIYTKELNGK